MSQESGDRDSLFHVVALFCSSSKIIVRVEKEGEVTPIEPAKGGYRPDSKA